MTRLSRIGKVYKKVFTEEKMWVGLVFGVIIQAVAEDEKWFHLGVFIILYFIAKHFIGKWEKEDE